MNCKSFPDFFMLGNKPIKLAPFGAKFEHWTRIG